MKIKIRHDDACSAEINDWHQMNDWIAELRDDSRAEPAGDGSPTPESAAVAPPPDWFTASAETTACAGLAGVAACAGVTACAGLAGVTACGGVTERAVIGDQLRRPIAW